MRVSDMLKEGVKFSYIKSGLGFSEDGILIETQKHRVSFKLPDFYELISGKKADDVCEKEWKRHTDMWISSNAYYTKIIDESEENEVKSVLNRMGGTTFALDHSINDVGEEVTTKRIMYRHSDGVFVLEELNCKNSKHMLLGKCNCKERGHKIFKERVISPQHVMMCLDRQ